MGIALTTCGHFPVFARAFPVGFSFGVFWPKLIRQDVRECRKNKELDPS